MPTSLPSFSSESLLQQAVAGLFRRMPNVRDVQILQGPTEEGKDIVFCSTGPLGESMPCACVVKNKKITGKVESPSGARAVLFQAQQCLDSPYTDAAGVEVAIERVYIITPYAVSKQVIDSIQGALAIKSRQVIFYDGHTLFCLFQRWWPDFLADEAAAIERFLKESSEELIVNAEITRLDSLYDLQPPTDRKVYVPLSFCRTFHDFEFDPTLRNSLPSEQKFLQDRWPENGHAQLERTYEAVREFVQRLNDWGFWKDPPVLSLKKFLPPAAEIIKRFPAAWISGVREIAPKWDPKTRKPELPKEARIKLANAAAFAEQARRIDQILQERTACFASLFSGYRREFSLLKSQHAGSALCSFPFSGNCELAKLEICLYHASRSFVRPIDSFKMIFDADLFDRINHSLLIVGPAGSGKTLFCRWNALCDASKYADNGNSRIPVYVPMHRMRIDKVRGFSELFGLSVGCAALIASENKKGLLASQKPIRLYLDGFDEITRPGDKDILMSIVKEGVEQHPQIQVILTSRDYVASPSLDWLPRVELSELPDNQIKDLAFQWLDSTEKTTEFCKQLFAFPSLLQMVRIPLLATLTILVFRQTGTLPESRIRLYRIFVELLCGGWDLTKGILRESLFTREAKNRILTEVAVLAHRNGEKQFHPDLLISATRRVFRHNHQIDYTKLERELRQDGVICAEGDQLRFVHLSIQEYFYATYMIGKAHTQELKRVIRLFDQGMDWWRDVLRFYIGLTNDPGGFAQWVEKQRWERTKELVAMAEEEAKSMEHTNNPFRIQT